MRTVRVLVARANATVSVYTKASHSSVPAR